VKSGVNILSTTDGRFCLKNTCDVNVSRLDNWSDVTMKRDRYIRRVL
jgi:hypothetical protein